MTDEIVVGTNLTMTVSEAVLIDDAELVFDSAADQEDHTLAEFAGGST